MAADIGTTKKCTKCGITNEATFVYFYHRADAKDGLAHWCKVCMDAKNKAYALANKERINAIRYRWIERHPEQRKAIISRPVYRAKRLAFARKYYYATKERFAERIKVNRIAWKRANPEKHKNSLRAANEKRLAAKNGSAGQFTSADLNRLQVLQKGRCAACLTWCGSKLHIDHIVSLARGGSH